MCSLKPQNSNKGVATLKKILILQVALLLSFTLLVTSCSRNEDIASDSLMDNSTTSSHSGTDDTQQNSLTDNSTTSSHSGTDDTQQNSDISSSTAAAAAAFGDLGWNMVLVNAKYPLPENYDIEMRAIKGFDERLFDVRAADALEQMLAAAEKAELQLYLVSAYRSPERQETLYNNKVQSLLDTGLSQAKAEAEAAMWVARPYTSEHNLGLAADIVSADWYSTHDDLTQDFEQTEHFDWLYENCAEYGFILRYPKEKAAITGVVYEPWHYRYVGKEAAQEIMSTGVTLEEYLGIV